MLYHLKALTAEDYEAWATIIIAFKASEQRAVQDTVHRLTLRESSHKHLRNSWIGGNSELVQLKETMSAMDAGFLDIKEQLDSIRVPDASRPPSGRERQASTDNKLKFPKFGMPALPRTTSDASVASAGSSDAQSRLQSSFDKLKSDKDKAFAILRSEIEKWEKNDRQYKQLLAESDMSVSRAESKATLSRHALEEAYIAHTRASMNSERSNSFTSSVNGSEIFYDAMDDAVLTADLSSADLSDLEDPGFDTHGDNSSDDEASTGKEEAPEPEKRAPEATLQSVDEPVVRRTLLPAPVSGEDISLLSILRKNVGKDLSTVAMPVSLNEPINVLQRLCEELEYSELLDKAVTLPDSLDRLVYVAAFAVSGYATTQWRAARKPFNPLHGETFEYVCPEKGMLIIMYCFIQSRILLLNYCRSHDILFFRLQVHFRKSQPLPTYHGRKWTVFVVALRVVTDTLTPDLYFT